MLALSGTIRALTFTFTVFTFTVEALTFTVLAPIGTFRHFHLPSWHLLSR
jgi:hypothetical protein